MKRPHHQCKEAVEAAVDAILNEVIQWLDDPKADREEVRTDLIQNASSDAYEFAKNLDDAYWSPDAALVDVLEGYSTWAAHRTIVKKWVSENSITVPFSVGDVVMARNERGRVVRVEPEMAQIIVQPETPDGNNYGDTGGWVINAEDATATEPVTA